MYHRRHSMQRTTRGQITYRWRLVEGERESGRKMVRTQHRGHTKLFTCTLSISSCNDGRMDVQKAMIVKERVSGVRHGVSDAHGSGVNAAARAQMRNFPHVLECVRFFAHRIQGTTDGLALSVSPVNGAKQLASADGQLDGLAGTLAWNECSHQLEGSSCPARILALLKPPSLFQIQNTLEGGTGRTVVKFDE